MSNITVKYEQGLLENICMHLITKNAQHILFWNPDFLHTKIALKYTYYAIWFLWHDPLSIIPCHLIFSYLRGKKS